MLGFGGPAFSCWGPGYTVAGQEGHCRPWVHLCVCFKCSPRFLPRSHCLAASFVHVRDSSSAKGNLLRADTRLQVETQNLCRKEIPELVNLPEDGSQTYRYPLPQTHCSQDPQRRWDEGLSSFGWCSSPPGVSSKTTHTSLLTACIVIAISYNHE